MSLAEERSTLRTGNLFAMEGTCLGEWDIINPAATSGSIWIIWLCHMSENGIYIIYIYVCVWYNIYIYITVYIYIWCDIPVIRKQLTLSLSHSPYPTAGQHHCMISSKGQCTGPDVKLWKQFLRSNFQVRRCQIGHDEGMIFFANGRWKTTVVSTWFNPSQRTCQSALEDAGCFMNIFDTTI